MDHSLYQNQTLAALEESSERKLGRKYCFAYIAES